MSKLNLKDVTLVCVDDRSPKMASAIMSELAQDISFSDVKLFSSLDVSYVTNKISPITSLVHYNTIVVKEIHKHIDTEYCMFIQTDGYPINIKAWTDEYYNYDYIGAPWTWVPFEARDRICPTGGCVGNGGFSMRKLSLMKEVSLYDYDPLDKDLIPKWSGNTTLIEEDTFICRIMGEDLKSKGFKFAPCELAKYFSVENDQYTGQFGFHGAKTIDINKRMGIFKFKDHAYERK